MAGVEILVVLFAAGLLSPLVIAPMSAYLLWRTRRQLRLNPGMTIDVERQCETVCASYSKYKRMMTWAPRAQRVQGTFLLALQRALVWYFRAKMAWTVHRVELAERSQGFISV